MRFGGAFAVACLGYFVAGMLTGAWYEHNCPTWARPVDGVTVCSAPPVIVGTAWPVYWSYRAASAITNPN